MLEKVISSKLSFLMEKEVFHGETYIKLAKNVENDYLFGEQYL